MLTSTSVQTVDVVYNLSEAFEGLYLPVAFIVSRDQDGYFAHIQQKATAATIVAFQLELTPVRKRLFELIDELQIKVIEDQYQQPRRKRKHLTDLIQDRDIKLSIFKYVHHRLDELLSLAVQHNFPISWDAERKALVNDFMLKVVDQPLMPQLYFQKTTDKVIYRLSMLEGEEQWRISEKDVVPIVNKPAWIFADYHLYRIAHLNGNLVKPFRQRDEVIIPSDKVQVYFKQFILKIVSKVEVEAKGFAVEQLTGLQNCQLKAVKHLFEDRWVLSIQMDYERVIFDWNESRTQRSALEMEGEEVRIVQVKRDQQAEEGYLAKLNKWELVPEEGSGYFRLANTDPDKGDQLISWLAKNRRGLEADGFQLTAPKTDEGQIYLYEPTVQINQDNSSDWLDLKGKVTIGEYSFPFIRLAKNIREGNPNYLLPNGEIFLIPQEWLVRYRDLFQFGRAEDDHIRLSKSQFTIVEALGISEQVLEDHLDAEEYLPGPDLKAQLRPYQLRGVRWLVQHYYRGLGACLADDMGLGKTLQTIAVLLFAKDKRSIPAPEEQKVTNGQISLFAKDADTLRPLNALIVLPASLVYNWAEEIKKFAPSLSIYRHTGPKRHKDPRLLARFDVILTTYQTALRDVDFLSDIVYEYIILDESQQIKNRESKVFRALNTLEAEHKVSLSGTPIENSLSDLWSQMHFINPDLLGSYGFFRKEFITPIERYQDEVKKDKLRKLVQPYLLRRTKNEVAPDLPELLKQTVFVEMTKEQKSLYEREKSAARNYLLENYDASSSQYRILVIQTLTKLRQLANHPSLLKEEYKKKSGKFDDILEQWEVIRKGGHKVLFFSSFVKYLELFRQEFEKRQHSYAWLTGQQSAKQRQEAIKSFQEDPSVQAFFISIKSGGTGLNLTAADYVFILDPWWNPTTEDQAIARAHRIGQDKKVLAKKFITRHSIEEKIKGLQDRKSQLAEDIIGPGEKLSLDRGEIEYLLS